MSKGQTLSLFTLMEVVLALVVLLSLMAAVNSMAERTSFFYSFFAKDNAHLVEALHAVPNGEAHVAYLFSNENFRVALNDDNVVVQSGGSKETGEVTSNSRKMKTFGKSASTPVTPQELFVPSHYQYVYLPGQARSIFIQKNFKEQLTCPASTVPFTGLSVTGSQQLLADDFADITAQSIAQGVKQAAAGYRQTLADEGTSIHIHVTKSFNTEVGVYYKEFNSHTVRLLCLITREASISKNVRPGSIQDAPQYLRDIDADIIIDVHIPQESSIEPIKTAIIHGISAYWEKTQ